MLDDLQDVVANSRNKLLPERHEQGLNLKIDNLAQQLMTQGQLYFQTADADIVRDGMFIKRATILIFPLGYEYIQYLKQIQFSIF